MIDNDRNGIAVWETGSMLLYLSKYYDKDFVLHFAEDEFETEMVRSSTHSSSLLFATQH